MYSEAEIPNLSVASFIIISVSSSGSNFNFTQPLFLSFILVDSLDGAIYWRWHKKPLVPFFFFA
jgi:hypothetical protein